MIKKKKYTDEQKQLAVDTVIEKSFSLSATSQLLEIPIGTLGRWVAEAKYSSPLPKKKNRRTSANKALKENRRLRYEIEKLKQQKVLFIRAIDELSEIIRLST